MNPQGNGPVDQEPDRPCSPAGTPRTDFWRALTLNYRPAWLVNNVVGQNLLYALNESTPGGAAAYARAVLDTLKETRGKTGRRVYVPEDLRFGLFRASEHRRKGASPPRPRASPQ